MSDAPGDGDEPALEVQDVFTFTLSELRGLSTLDPSRGFRPDGVREAEPPPRLITMAEDEYGDYNEARQRRVKIIAWVVIVSLILVGGGATVLALIFG